MEGRAVLRIADGKVQSTPVRLTAQLEPRFCPEQFTVGTRLAYRLEELGVTDYFAVPGMSEGAKAEAHANVNRRLQLGLT